MLEVFHEWAHNIKTQERLSYIEWALTGLQGMLMELLFLHIAKWSYPN